MRLGHLIFVFTIAPIGSNYIVSANDRGVCAGPSVSRRCDVSMKSRGTWSYPSYPCREGKKDFKSMGIFPSEMLDTLPWFAIDSVENEYCDCDELSSRDNGDLGMTGVGCTEMFQRCPDGSVCFHGAPCQKGDEDNFFCDCSDAFYPEGKTYVGMHCEYEVTSFCTSSLHNSKSMCANYGSCRDDGEITICDCPTGFHGHYCEFRGEAPKCDTECFNDGICEIGVKQYDHLSDPLKEYLDQYDGYDSHCICLEGFTGRQCESEITNCGGAECLNGSTCSTHLQYSFCDCGKASNSIKTSEKELETNYAGHHCESSSSTFCLPPPGFDARDFFCTNNGTCPTNHWDACSCPIGYSGPRCEFLVKYHKNCDLQCKNGGTCFFGDELTYTPYVHLDHEKVSKQTHGVMHCKCPDGYTGLFCDTEVAICGALEHYCLNNGECNLSDDGYTCECPHVSDAPSAGEYCEHAATTICGDASFCTNNGVCKNDLENGDHPECICPNGFTGNFCEFTMESKVIVEDIMWINLVILFFVFILIALICISSQKKGCDEHNSHVPVDTLPGHVPADTLQGQRMFDVQLT